MQSPAFGVIPNKRHRLEPLRFQQARQRVLAQGDDAESDAGEQGEGGAVSRNGRPRDHDATTISASLKLSNTNSGYGSTWRETLRTHAPASFGSLRT